MPLFLVAISYAAGAVELDTLVGNWRGEGVVAAEIGKEPERARCKATIEAAADPDAREVTITGRCAIPAGASRFVLRIVDDGDDNLRAGFRAQRMEETVQMAGKRTEDGALVFETREPVSVREQDWWARVRIEPAPDEGDAGESGAGESGAGFVLRQWARPAGEAQGQGQEEPQEGADGEGEGWRLVSEVLFEPVEPSGGK